jgi:hypothetical protein
VRPLGELPPWTGEGEVIAEGWDLDPFAAVDAMRARMAENSVRRIAGDVTVDAKATLPAGTREAWDDGRVAFLLEDPDTIRALGVTVRRSQLVPWREVWAFRAGNAEPVILLGDAPVYRVRPGGHVYAPTSVDRLGNVRPAGATLDVAELVRREVLLETKAAVRSALWPLADPWGGYDRAREANRLDALLWAPR